jgi:hypothetical protein
MDDEPTAEDMVRWLALVPTHNMPDGEYMRFRAFQQRAAGELPEAAR